MLMHQQARELQQSLEERELSAQDLRVWINTLERELDQRGDTEEQLKGQAHHPLGAFSRVGALPLLRGRCFDFLVVLALRRSAGWGGLCGFCA